MPFVPNAPIKVLDKFRSAHKCLAPPAAAGMSKRRFLALYVLQKIGHTNSIEVEHLCARQFSIAEAVQPQNHFIYALSVATAATLVPQDYDVIAVSGNDLRIHLSLRFGGLQRLPNSAPAARLWFDTTKGSSIR